MELRRIRTAIVAMVGCDNGVDHDAVMYMGGGDSHIVHRINRFSETHMTREYQFEVDFACCLWFAISFLTVLIPLVVPDGAIHLGREICQRSLSVFCLLNQGTTLSATPHFHFHIDKDP